MFVNFPWYDIPTDGHHRYQEIHCARSKDVAKCHLVLAIVIDMDHKAK